MGTTAQYAKANFVGYTSNIYWKSFVANNDGINGGAAKTDIISVSYADDIWFIVDVHAKYVAASSGWVITMYLNDTKVAQETLTNGTYALQPYFNFYNNNEALVNYGLVDWVSFQYTHKFSVPSLT